MTIESRPADHPAGTTNSAGNASSVGNASLTGRARPAVGDHVNAGGGRPGPGDQRDGARPQAHAVRALQRAVKCDAGGTFANTRGAEFVELLDQKIRQAARATGDQ